MVHQGRDIIQDSGTEAVELVYRPTRADVLQGIRVRERVRGVAPARWIFVVLFAGFAAFTALGGMDAAALTALSLLTAVLIGATPRIQANQVFRAVSWQGEYRVTVTDAGITVETGHTTLVQRWTLFRGYRETSEHVVLLSRDPGILVVEVEPKRGLRGEEDLDRLRTLLDRHVARV
ncbi:YcxB family protein [Streptomyces capillispiralis]|uniref:YcxB family protein n=1 Tax=Streptomyces capillispiralis TaxID=68182 RepID=UPI003680E63C